MTISPDLKPDPREVYEPKLCRLRNVYKAVKARRPYYCDECGSWIVEGELHDTVSVSKCGVAGHTHPVRLHCTCRKDYVDRQNEKYAVMHNILPSICMICGIYFGYQDARGNPGLSHGLCGNVCEATWMGEMCEAPEVR